MPKLVINVEGKGGAYADRLRKCEQILDVEEAGGELYLEVLDGGMQSGEPSISFIIIAEIPLRVGKLLRLGVIAQTSLKLFQVAAAATLAKYGDRTGGGFIGAFDQGGKKAELTLSEETQCPACRKRIPSSCRYCFNCGAKL